MDEKATPTIRTTAAAKKSRYSGFGSSNSGIGMGSGGGGDSSRGGGSVRRSMYKYLLESVPKSTGTLEDGNDFGGVYAETETGRSRTEEEEGNGENMMEAKEEDEEAAAGGGRTSRTKLFP